MKIWFQNHRYKTKKAISERGFDGFGPNFSPRRLGMPLLMREGLAYKHEALLGPSPLAGLGLPPQFPFNPLAFPPPPFLAPPSSGAASVSSPSQMLPQHALLSAFSQNMKQSAGKLWWTCKIRIIRPLQYKVPLLFHNILQLLLYSEASAKVNSV